MPCTVEACDAWQSRTADHGSGARKAHVSRSVARQRWRRHAPFVKRNFPVTYRASGGENPHALRGPPSNNWTPNAFAQRRSRDWLLPYCLDSPEVDKRTIYLRCSRTLISERKDAHCLTRISLAEVGSSCPHTCVFLPELSWPCRPGVGGILGRPRSSPGRVQGHWHQ